MLKCSNLIVQRTNVIGNSWNKLVIWFTSSREFIEFALPNVSLNSGECFETSLKLTKLFTTIIKINKIVGFNWSDLTIRWSLSFYYFFLFWQKAKWQNSRLKLVPRCSRRFGFESSFYYHRSFLNTNESNLDGNGQIYKDP